VADRAERFAPAGIGGIKATGNEYAHGDAMVSRDLADRAAARAAPGRAGQNLAAEPALPDAAGGVADLSLAAAAA
jgi:hypothetical protein